MLDNKTHPVLHFPEYTPKWPTPTKKMRFAIKSPSSSRKHHFHALLSLGCPAATPISSTEALCHPRVPSSLSMPRTTWPPTRISRLILSDALVSTLQPRIEYLFQASTSKKPFSKHSMAYRLTVRGLSL